MTGCVSNCMVVVSPIFAFALRRPCESTNTSMMTISAAIYLTLKHLYHYQLAEESFGGGSRLVVKISVTTCAKFLVGVKTH